MKQFILDTNVLLHDPSAINHFPERSVIIPLKVLEEIDQFKRELSERGRNARRVARMLDDLRSRGRLSEGIQMDNGGTLTVAFPKDHDPFSTKVPVDDLILQMARELSNGNGSVPCTLISKDINLRLKADALGLEAEDYENGQVQTSELFAGYSSLDVSAADLSRFAGDGRLPAPEEHRLSPNEYICLRDEKDAEHTMLARYDVGENVFIKILSTPETLRPIKPRNMEQRFAMDALLDDRIRLVTLAGKAGTGKTLLAVAAGVHKTIDERKYRKMLVSRPIFPMGKDIGYLPGTVEEKLDPWMQPILDALDLIKQGRPSDRKSRDLSITGDLIEVEPLTYIRGRSIPNQFIIIDESQNLTPLEVKTVITRVGHHTKIILTGDLYQIDNPYVDALSNGLNAVVEKFRDQGIAAHVMLNQGVRSEVAELAANLL
ncbi:MAG: PhoH family protein [Verrucomicrobia bacterium]|nr:PhoH family protein [Verrucomicrobiota bacterium]